MTNELSDIRNGTCPVCRASNPILERQPTISRTFQLRCARCGSYDITFEAVSELNNLLPNSQLRPLAAEWIWEQNSLGITPQITVDTIAMFSTRPPLPFYERAKRLLVHLASQTVVLGSTVAYADYPPITAMLQTLRPSEVAVVAQFLAGRGWIRIEGIPAGQACVLGEGFIQAEAWKGAAPQSAQGFVAMWFDDSTNGVWDNGLQKGIKDAGFRPLRINMKEHVNKICDEIIAEIRRSRFVVADYTGQRGGVYYEAGYAAGRGLPVILTCRKDEMNKLHFDVRQYNCIDWQSPNELAQRLKVRIEAVIGDGPLK